MDNKIKSQQEIEQEMLELNEQFSEFLHTKGIIKKFKFGKENKIDLCRDLDLLKIPNNGEEITVSWKHNLSGGAEPIVIDETDEYLEQVRNIALSAGNTLNIKFASIDIVVTEQNEILVMEINGSVCMNKFSEVISNGYEIAKSIYSKAIDKMFE